MGCGSSSLADVEEPVSNGTLVNGDIKHKHQNGSAAPVSRRKSGLAVNNNTNKAQIEEEGDEEEQNVLKISTPEEVEAMLSALEEGELFCDPDFPPGYSALYCSPGRNYKNVTWCRPQELVPEGEVPELMVDGVTRDDIKQGILGDCWFLSACAAVSQHDSCMKKVMPPNQQLSGPSYKGVVCFKFWRFGRWVPVYVDDRLPCVFGQLIYGHSADPREFWVSLIEKAYAKLHGSYEGIEGGTTMDAMVDLTGGLAERYSVTEYDPSVYQRISQAHKSGAFVTCAKEGDWRNSTKAEANGLVPGHAYTVTDVTKIRHEMGEEKLVRLRNPWGDATEWRGSWSDDDVNWQWVDEATKEKIQGESRDDGEFWMSFRDFCRHFQEITVCLLGPDFDGDGVQDAAGHMETAQGQWEVGVSAGGSRNDLEKFATNPQFVLTLHEADDFNIDTDDAESEGKCAIVISLMQHLQQTLRTHTPKSLQIGFAIYKTETPDARLPARHFRYTRDSGKNGNYINFREVSGRFELDPGAYVVIPSTFHPDSPASFMLRVFGEKRFSLAGPLPS
ncbi:calpain-B-like [Babylonia areolata]|uniref:calpain-B-like n=1 Tax=Babylonia areolata TaxID=304850 RepID=UPI003FD47001